MDAWWSWFSNLQDDQRIERLQRCQEIQNVLLQCQQQQQQQQQRQQRQKTIITTSTNSIESPQYDPLSIESFSGGIRTMKYFGWRGILQQPQQPHEDDDPSQQQKQLEGRIPERVHNAIVHSCSREQHALWACRAVAVGCGKELGSLKAGFDSMGPWNVLFQPRTAYDEKSTPDDDKSHPIPCAELQSSLGTCVRRGADALLERTQTRDKSQPLERTAAAAAAAKNLQTE
jgi:hypothetical protein